MPVVKAKVGDVLLEVGGVRFTAPEDGEYVVMANAASDDRDPDLFCTICGDYIDPKSQACHWELQYRYEVLILELEAARTQLAAAIRAALHANTGQSPA